MQKHPRLAIRVRAGVACLLLIFFAASTQSAPQQKNSSGSVSHHRKALTKPVRVAVASNFIDTFKKIEAAFEHNTTSHIEAVYGSTGQLAAQILQGAPFDIFLSADETAIDKLAAANRIVDHSRTIYACGHLALASISEHAPQNQADAESLLNSHARSLAIAKPRLAPYGRASVEALANLNANVKGKNPIIWGQNIGQVFHYVVSGNVQWGFIAAAQARQYESAQKYKPGQKLSLWPVPANLHKPIRQMLGVTQNGAKKPVAIEFAAFMQSRDIKQLVRSAGYSVPPQDC